MKTILTIQNKGLNLESMDIDCLISLVFIIIKKRFLKNIY
jgi:hypothetical protein